MQITPKKTTFKPKFKQLKHVNNPNSIHGIYPYRGKISPIDAENLIIQLPQKGTLLDPFCGSGTIIYEARKKGLDVIGVDANPIAIQISKAKFEPTNIDNSLQKLNEFAKQKSNSSKFSLPEAALKFFHEETASEISIILNFYEKLNEYEKAAFLGAICLAARGCNHYKWTSTQIGKISDQKRYINFLEKFTNKLIKHNYPLENNHVSIIFSDTRKLSSKIQESSVNYVYTSPPYFDALDYTSYYTRIIHKIFENRVDLIKANLIQNFASYEEDMKKCFDELVKVTADNAIIIFVVGDKKKGKKTINGGEFFSNIYKIKPNIIKEREYTKTASKVWDKINKTDRKEQIIIWDKSTW